MQCSFRGKVVEVEVVEVQVLDVDVVLLVDVPGRLLEVEVLLTVEVVVVDPATVVLVVELATVVVVVGGGRLVLVVLEPPSVLEVVLVEPTTVVLVVELATVVVLVVVDGRRVLLVVELLEVGLVVVDVVEMSVVLVLVVVDVLVLVVSLLVVVVLVLVVVGARLVLVDEVVATVPVVLVLVVVVLVRVVLVVPPPGSTYVTTSRGRADGVPWSPAAYATRSPTPLSSSSSAKAMRTCVRPDLLMAATPAAVSGPLAPSPLAIAWLTVPAAGAVAAAWKSLAASAAEPPKAPVCTSMRSGLMVSNGSSPNAPTRSSRIAAETTVAASGMVAVSKEKMPRTWASVAWSPTCTLAEALSTVPPLPLFSDDSVTCPSSSAIETNESIIGFDTSTKVTSIDWESSSPPVSVTDAVMVWVPTDKVDVSTCPPLPNVPSRSEVQAIPKVRLPSSASLAKAPKLTTSPAAYTVPSPGSSMVTTGCWFGSCAQLEVASIQSSTSCVPFGSTRLVASGGMRSSSSSCIRRARIDDPESPGANSRAPGMPRFPNWGGTSHTSISCSETS
jgi:hypothetical protein